MTSLRVGATVLGLLVGFGCGDDDGGTDGDASVGCVTDVDCDDGRFCNGVESCDPGATAAEGSGCVSGAAPCLPGMCNETAGACETECRDADGDGHRSELCGGDDCDDEDADAFPGNPEVCDSEGHDEDCDPDTFGPDMDGDGYVSDECCNLRDSGARRCGLDCDDSTSDVNPEVIDQCGGGDENCDGDIDDMPELVFYRDIDGDGYGVPSDTVMACGAPSGYAFESTDCNDMLAANNPGNPELCNVGTGETPDPMVDDEDCDGAVDEECPCPDGESRACGGAEAMAMTGLCRPGTQTCGASGWGPCSSIEPTSEVCNGDDDDCDGSVDEDFECAPSTVEDGTNACGNPGTRTCRADCNWVNDEFGTPETNALCNYCDDTGTGTNAETPFASSSRTLQLADSPLVAGSAYYDDTIRVVAGGVNQAGSVTSVPFVLGHRTATITMNMNVSARSTTPGDGWAVFFVEDGTPPFLGLSGGFLGVPRDRTGFAAEWTFYDRSDTSAFGNGAYFRRLSATAGDPILERDDNGALPALETTQSLTQRITVTIQPDEIGTPANETAVVADVGGAVVGCGGTRSACGFALTPGDSYRWGVSGGTGAWVAFATFSSLTTGTAQIELTGLCD